jgi:hypothetical protein
MSLRKRLFAEAVQLLTKKIIYVRRVRPKAMDLCLANNFGGSGRDSHPNADAMALESAQKRIISVLYFILAVVAGEMVTILPPAHAEHEVDHRFIVEGYVCDGDGQSMANQEVMVKDTRIPLGKTTYTDSDAKDMKAERKMIVNFGSGCEGTHPGSGQWIYYGVGLGLAGVAVFAGAKMIRKQRRPVRRGKSQRK